MNDDNQWRAVPVMPNANMWKLLWQAVSKALLRGQK